MCCKNDSFRVLVSQTSVLIVFYSLFTLPRLLHFTILVGPHLCHFSPIFKLAGAEREEMRVAAKRNNEKYCRRRDNVTDKHVLVILFRSHGPTVTASFVSGRSTITLSWIRGQTLLLDAAGGVEAKVASDPKGVV